jgi:hypothetical protein
MKSTRRLIAWPLIPIRAVPTSPAPRSSQNAERIRRSTAFIGATSMIAPERDPCAQENSRPPFSR